MWVVTNNGLLSVVRSRAKGFQGMFVVRARRKQDLHHFFGNKEAVDEALLENVGTDYEYRVYCTPEDLKAALNRQVDLIDYGNFKDSIPETDHDLRRFAGEVWLAGCRNLASDENTLASVLRMTSPVNQRSVAPAGSVNTSKKVKSRR